MAVGATQENRLTMAPKSFSSDDRVPKDARITENLVKLAGIRIRRPLSFGGGSGRHAAVMMVIMIILFKYVANVLLIVVHKILNLLYLTVKTL